MALDLYYANGEFERSEVYGNVIRNLCKYSHHADCFRELM